MPPRMEMATSSPFVSAAPASLPRSLLVKTEGWKLGRRTVVFAEN